MNVVTVMVPFLDGDVVRLAAMGKQFLEAFRDACINYIPAVFDHQYKMVMQ